MYMKSLFYNQETKGHRDCQLSKSCHGSGRADILTKVDSEIAISKRSLIELTVRVHAKVLQSCLTLCNPMDYSPPDSSVHGILQARILEWVAIPFSRGSSECRD